MEKSETSIIASEIIKWCNHFRKRELLNKVKCAYDTARHASKNNEKVACECSW
jgi:hypothetical protein